MRGHEVIGASLETFGVGEDGDGGRFSALSLFGLVPAALVGVDVPRLLGDAMSMACATESGCATVPASTV